MLIVENQLSGEQLRGWLRDTDVYRREAAVNFDLSVCVCLDIFLASPEDEQWLE
jgi:hypothetical protein